MLAADTNILVRLIVSDDPAQQKRVLKRLEEVLADGDSVFVPAVVVAELGWVLKAAYGYERSRIADAIERLSGTPPLIVEHKGAVAEALEAYRAGPAEFSDYLILFVSRAAGATPLLSLDKKLQKAPGCTAP